MSRRSRTADYAVLAAALALAGVTLAAWARWTAARAADAAQEEAAATAERLGELVRNALAAARMRVDALAATPVVRAAVDSDPVVARDLARDEHFVFSAGPHETIELYQVPKGHWPVSLLRQPAGARAIVLHGASEQRVDAANGALVVTVAAPVAPLSARAALGGAMAVSTPLSLSSFAAGPRAELVGLDEPLALGIDRPLEGTRVVTTPLPLPAGTAPAALTLRTAVAVGGGAALWAGRLLLTAALLVALLAFVEHRRRRRLPIVEDAPTSRRAQGGRQPNAPAAVAAAATARQRPMRPAVAAPAAAWSAEMPTPIRQLVPQRDSLPLVIDPRGDALAGRYRLLSLIGHGHCADVYLAQSFVGAGTVALKLLGDGVERAPYLDVAQQQMRLAHPNVVRVFDVGDGEIAYVAMEYVEGCTLEVLLRDLFARAALLPISQTVAMVAAICRALDAAGPLVHGAVKPSNVLVGRRNLVKLSDFGAPPSPSDRHAPEQHVGRRADRRSDVYAVGLILHELLTARSVELPASDARRWPPLPAPSSLRPELSRALDAVVHKATRFGPRGRHATAGDLLDHLMRATGDTTPALASAWLGDWVDRARRSS